MPYLGGVRPLRGSISAMFLLQRKVCLPHIVKAKPHSQSSPDSEAGRAWRQLTIARIPTLLNLDGTSVYLFLL